MEVHELIAYLDKRFAENARQIDERFAENAQQIERQIDERSAANARQIDERFAANARQIDERFAESTRQVDKRFAESAQQIAQFREETNGRFEHMEGRLDQGDGRLERLEESVRHTQIQVEGLRGDTRLLAEKIGTFDEKIESVRSELKAEIGDVKDLLVRSYRDHDSRIRALESRVKKRAPGKGRPHLE